MEIKAKWPKLLRDIADELGLSVGKEHDLISFVSIKRALEGL